MHYMKQMVFSFLFAGLALPTLRAGGTPWAKLETAPAVGEPIKPFNGKDLNGWYVVVLDKGVVENSALFQVEDGVIHVYKDEAGHSRQPSAGLFTKAEYRDYRLTLEYKWGEKKFEPRAGADSVRDAGVCYNVRGSDMIWPTAAECQIQEGDTGDIWLINAQGSSTVHPENLNYVTPADGGVDVVRGTKPVGFQRFIRSNAFEVPGWNTVEITVRGDSAVYRVNGHVNNRVRHLKYFDAKTQSWQPLTSGKILLQAEFAEIYYRNISIQPIDPAGDD